MLEHRFPLVVGKDFAGTIEALGAGVYGFAVGDAVFGVVMQSPVSSSDNASSALIDQRDQACRWLAMPM